MPYMTQQEMVTRTTEKSRSSAGAAVLDAARAVCRDASEDNKLALRLALHAYDNAYEAPRPSCEEHY